MCTQYRWQESEWWSRSDTSSDRVERLVWRRKRGTPTESIVTAGIPVSHHGLSNGNDPPKGSWACRRSLIQCSRPRGGHVVVPKCEAAPFTNSAVNFFHIKTICSPGHGLSIDTSLGPIPWSWVEISGMSCRRRTMFSIRKYWITRLSLGSDKLCEFLY